MNDDLFSYCIEIVLKNEGGAQCTNNPEDPGGMTKYGIAKKYHPKIDIEHLTQSQAEEIYRKEYWNRYDLETLPVTDKSFYAKFFDTIISIGYSQAVKILQRALLACGGFTHSTISISKADDGNLGPQTRAALKVATDQGIAPLISAFNAELAAFRRLSHNKEFLDGWLHRAYKTY